MQRRRSVDPPKGCGATMRCLNSQVSGQRGDRQRPVAPFLLGVADRQIGIEAEAAYAPSRPRLYERHIALGARMVDFGGWSMPLQYSSQIEEHLAVRRDAGVFDVSHMCVST